MAKTASIRTPCIRVCAVDGAKGLCIGCGRTLKEIAQWTAFSDAERDAICETLAVRLANAAASQARA
ncbi:MAG: DUF1289 domain-containing protein [Alphaproteobacteria bacterium]|nr:DUF1289 domain-containing protein [Alphaproteobacteria bacterium]